MGGPRGLFRVPEGMIFELEIVGSSKFDWGTIGRRSSFDWDSLFGASEQAASIRIL